MHIENIDLQNRLDTGLHNIEVTDAAYATYLNQFAEFLRSADRFEHGSKMIDKELFTDQNIASFLFMMQDKHNSKPHFLKVIRASIGYGLKRNGLKSINENQDFYFATHDAIKVFYYKYVFNYQYFSNG